MQDGIKGEVEALRGQLSAVRAQQAPWEAQLAEVNGRAAVAAAERDLLLKKQADAEKRLTVCPYFARARSTPACCLGFEMRGKGDLRGQWPPSRLTH
jgi:hypothetical protein